ncbi:hypothetical protein DFH07DRAFT_923784 [Mycena maculata]|uniref:Uncharacterized protein n=1 Tax=Mycena maculata TaxID=230809 RepID=A0AAD7N694_9AGAR|nr:hypothetical protein DFH07DRAFT_923784 [Mycena maculata]
MPQASSEGKLSWEGRDINDLDWPTWDLPGPFTTYDLGDREPEWGPAPKTLAELRMYELSWVLRSKPEWQPKAADPHILSKWRREALEQQESVSYGARLTAKMVDYVLAELSGYAKIADNERGIENGCFDAIWYSDRVVSDDITQRLKIAASALENVPETEKDWHPRSNGQVLDLVHPSLYCVVYGRTHAYLPDKPHVPANFLPIIVPTFSGDQEHWSISQAFCWMPSDFSVLPDGSVSLVSPYINNLHPEKHQPLYRIIEDVLTGFIPMFERVLSGIDREQDALKESGRIDDVNCIWGSDDEPCHDSDDETETRTKEEFLEFYNSKKALPEACTYTDQLESVLSSPISLRGRTIQCIIKLANIHLTPEQPEYAGGSWHVEGMANEHIVASGIYYYDEENITESRLSFRIPTGQPKYHRQDDGECMETLYGITRDQECVQEIGSMVTKAGRALSWPNLFQHRVSSFKLSDISKPGHRKILAIFLVDPTVDPIASATDVPPQQTEWVAEAFEAACNVPNSVLASLPQELRDVVKDQFPATLMTLKEAEAYRLELMEERTEFVYTHSETAYGVRMNMCEH